jgi:TM2 domain-containing membrane protein YozV
MEIYIAKNKTQMGPYDIGQVTQMLQSGIMEKHDLYWHEGMLDWAPVGSLQGMEKQRNLNSSAYQAQTVPQIVIQHPQAISYPSSGPQHSGQRKSRVAFVLLGLFLGGLGIHNFYAGYTGKGVTQLLITLLAGWLILPLALIGLWVLIEIITETKDAQGIRFI